MDKECGNLERHWERSEARHNLLEHIQPSQSSRFDVTREIWNDGGNVNKILLLPLIHGPKAQYLIEIVIENEVEEEKKSSQAYARTHHIRYAFTHIN